MSNNEHKTTYIDDKELSLSELQKLVGGYIQVAYSDDERQIVCNEEGKLMGLPINREATKYWHDCLSENAFYEMPDVLMGDVVVLTDKALMQ